MHHDWVAGIAWSGEDEEAFAGVLGSEVLVFDGPTKLSDLFGGVAHNKLFLPDLSARISSRAVWRSLEVGVLNPNQFVRYRNKCGCGSQ